MLWAGKRDRQLVDVVEVLSRAQVVHWDAIVQTSLPGVVQLLFDLITRTFCYALKWEERAPPYAPLILLDERLCKVGSNFSERGAGVSSKPLVARLECCTLQL